MSSSEIPIPIVNDGDLDESDEDTDEFDEHEENLNNTDSIPNPPSQPSRNLNDVLNGEEEDVAIDLDNGNDDEDGFNSDPSLVTIALPPPTKFPNSDHKNHQQPNPHLYQDNKKIQIPIQQIQQQQPLDDSRKLFQRLWTDEDEIELLQGFLEYMTQRGISYHNHHDLGLFYEQIKSKLQIDFSKNQLVEKLRRLKRKYRTALNRTSAGKDISFKSPHDHATYEISRKIWSDLSSNKDGGGVGIDDEDTNTTPVPVPAPNLSPNPSYNFFNQNAHYPHLNGVFDDRKLSSQNSHKRSRVSEERILMPNLNQGHGQSSNLTLGPGIHELVEETVKSCLSPLINEALNNKGNELRGHGSRGFGGLMLSQLGLNFGSPSNLMGGEASERKWRKQQILELEVYSKRLELVQEQIKVTLETLRSGNNQH